MSKEAKKAQKDTSTGITMDSQNEVAPVVPLTPPTPSTAGVPGPVQPMLVQNLKLSDLDKLQLDLAKSNRKTALANAQKALAENEVAELNFKYLVLQLYMKYGLTDADAIGEDGSIVKNGALGRNPQQLPVK